MVGFKSSLGLPFEGAHVRERDEPVSWIANNSRKLSQSGRVECWTVLSTAEFGSAHKVPQENIPPGKRKEVAAALLASLSRVTGVKQLPEVCFTRVQQVDFPTRQKKTLDLILTTHPSLKTRCKALPSVGNSDHDVVLYDTSLRPFRPKPPKRKILLWKKANVHAIRKDMEEYAQTFDIDTSKPDALETAWRGFSERVQKTINKNVPSKTTQGRYSYPWIDTSLRRAIRRKQRAHTKARKTGKKRDQDRYKRLQQEVKDNIKKASHHYLDTVVTDDFKTNSKKLWAYAQHYPERRRRRRRVQLWGAALPLNTYSSTDECLFDAPLQVGVCGDWLVSPCIQGAALSGMAMAQKIQQHMAGGGHSTCLRPQFKAAPSAQIGAFPTDPNMIFNPKEKKK
ncbi:hypothetical protein ACOMHN_007605 [Nucella lapillus]